MTRYSHAGGVVARSADGEWEYLLVEARRSRGEWVLPKGHIETGETPEASCRTGGPGGGWRARRGGCTGGGE